MRGVCWFLPRIRSWQVELRKTPASEDCKLPSGTQEPCAGDLGLKPLGARKLPDCHSRSKTPPLVLAAPRSALTQQPLQPQRMHLLPVLHSTALPLGERAPRTIPLQIHRADGWRSLPESGFCSCGPVGVTCWVWPGNAHGGKDSTSSRLSPKKEWGAVLWYQCRLLHQGASSCPQCSTFDPAPC